MQICCKALERASKSGAANTLAGMSILNLDSDSHQPEAVRKRKFDPERESKALPKVPQLAPPRARSRESSTIAYPTSAEPFSMHFASGQSPEPRLW